MYLLLWEGTHTQHWRLENLPWIHQQKNNFSPNYRDQYCGSTEEPKEESTQPKESQFNKPKGMSVLASNFQKFWVSGIG
jgi:hypothetical protein